MAAPKKPAPLAGAKPAKAAKPGKAKKTAKKGAARGR